MTMQLNPYLTFEGNTQQAMEFYRDVLGGELRAMTFRQAGMEFDGVMHAALETPAGFHIYASDIVPQMGQTVTHGTTVQISLSGDEGETLRGYWDKLSEGGKVVMPFERQMWGDDYGLLEDRFGIQWHVNVSNAGGGGDAAN